MTDPMTRIRALLADLEAALDELDDAHAQALRAAITRTASDAASAGVEAGARAIVESGRFTTLEQSRAATADAVKATLEQLHDRGFLVWPGEVRDVRVVSLPESEMVAELVRDPAGRVVGFETITRTVKP